MKKQIEATFSFTSRDLREQFASVIERLEPGVLAHRVGNAEVVVERLTFGQFTAACSVAQRLEGWLADAVVSEA